MKTILDYIRGTPVMETLLQKYNAELKYSRIHKYKKYRKGDLVIWLYKDCEKEYNNEKYRRCRSRKRRVEREVFYADATLETIDALFEYTIIYTNQYTALEYGLKPSGAHRIVDEVLFALDRDIKRIWIIDNKQIAKPVYKAIKNMVKINGGRAESIKKIFEYIIEHKRELVMKTYPNTIPYVHHTELYIGKTKADVLTAFIMTERNKVVDAAIIVNKGGEWYTYNDILLLRMIGLV